MAVMFMAGVVFSMASINAQMLNLSGTVEISLPGQQLSGEDPNPGDDGAISTWVVDDSSLDPGGYIFIYQVTNSGPDAVGFASLSGYTSDEIISTATYSDETGLTLTGALTPSTDGNFTGFELVGGNTATFEDGDLPNNSPDNISYFLVIDTDTSAFMDAYGQEADTFSAEGAIEAPEVPEPSSLTLLVCFVFFYGLFKCRQAGLKRENSA